MVTTAAVLVPVSSPDVPTASTRFVGIDVSKKKLDILILPGGKAYEVPNTPTNWAQLIVKLNRKSQPTTIVLEATGSYHLGVTLALTEAGWPVVTANPRQVRDFARALGKLAKTDPIDAWVLARYGEAMKPSPRPLPTANERRLEALIARRADVVKMRAQELNRQQAAAELVQPSIAATIAWFDDEITKLEAEIAAAVAADPAIKARVALLRTVPGIGPLVGPLLAARLPELAELTGPQLAALVGVAPMDQQSGTKRGKAWVRGGRGDVRLALYQAVHTACRCDPVIGARSRHLQDDLGKTLTSAKVALIRWLLGVLHAMVRDNVVWQETRLVTSFVKEKEKA